MTAGRRRTKIVTRLHVVSKPIATGKRWYVYAWRGGPCIHRCDGAKPIIDRAILDAQYRAEQEHLRQPAETIDALVDSFRAAPEFKDRRPATQKDYRLWLDRISARFGTTPLEAFEDRRMRGDVIDWRNGWAGQPRTADKASVMMAILLNYGVENGRLAVNVAAGIKQLHSVNKADEVWEDRHWKAVAAVKDFPAHIMDALKLAHMTGLRLGDLVRLDWASVGDHAIIVETRKRGGRAVIPIYPELRKHLEVRKHREGTVLRNSRDGSWTESGLETVWQRRKPEGFDRTIHDLRGTYATWLAMKGMTDEQIARIIGWTAKRVGEIRARYVDEARVIISMVERLSA